MRLSLMNAMVSPLLTVTCTTIFPNTSMLLPVGDSLVQSAGVWMPTGAEIFAFSHGSWKTIGEHITPGGLPQIESQDFRPLSSPR
jgi:hypothetical protein